MILSAFQLVSFTACASWSLRACYLSGNYLLASKEDPAEKSPTRKKTKNFEKKDHLHGPSSPFLAVQSENSCVKKVAELNPTW